MTSQKPTSSADDPEDLPAEILETADPPSFQNGTKLRPDTIKALEMMAYEGIDHVLAAQRVGMRSDNLLRVFNAPHIKAIYNQLVAHIRTNAGMQAYVRINRLAQTSESDHVKLEANKWVAGVDGMAPVKRVEGKINHNVEFGGFSYPTIDVSPDQASGGIDDQDTDNTD